MTIKSLILISLIALGAGSILFLIDKEYIVIRISHSTQHAAHTMQHSKKEISFYFWQNNAWLEEKKQCLWSNTSGDHKQANLKQLVITWLATLQAELGIPTAHITVQSAALNPTGYLAYISLDAFPFAAHFSMHEKLMLIEGLLKTIRSSDVSVQSIQFLHNHQPMLDAHLDFSQPWPIQGFTNR